MTIDDFLVYVLPDAVGCPRVTARQAVLIAAKEFLTASGVWNEIQDPITISNNAYEYDLEAPSGARCIDVRDVYASYMSSGRLMPVTMEQLALASPNWATETGSLPNRYTRAFDYTSIRVLPIPTSANGEQIRIHAVYTLKDTADSIPDEIIERFGDSIASGAKARLMRMSKVAWQDLNLSQFHQKLFDDAKTRASIALEHSKTRADVRVPPRRFGR